HNIGEFVSNISNMPRIVTFHDFTLTIEPNTSGPDSNMSAPVTGTNPELSMNVKAKTYWATNSLE
ncbi:MAG: Pilus assembly protein PilO, partial [Pseudomonadota bacterium]